jgi:hypothetical protein
MLLKSLPVLIPALAIARLRGNSPVGTGTCVLSSFVLVICVSISSPFAFLVLPLFHFSMPSATEASTKPNKPLRFPKLTSRYRRRRVFATAQQAPG